MHTVYMLIGLPGVGKSSWILEQGFSANSFVVASTDQYIEQRAIELSTTYDSIFKDTISWANQQMYRDIQYCFEHGLDLIWDQTNLTVKSRQQKLSKVPEGYFKKALVFSISNLIEHQRRLSLRPGKTISNRLLAQMRSSYVAPSLIEGFDIISYIEY